MPSRTKAIQRPPTPSEVRTKMIIIAVLAVFCVLAVWPGYVNRGIDWMNSKAHIGVPHIPNRPFSLGLDLQGGANLIYEANTSQIADADKASAVEGVRDVIERRVRGGLGVSEPLVQTTRVGADYRIIVELPGINDVQQAINMIGATPVLDFKEQNDVTTVAITPAQQAELTAFNAAALKTATADLAAIRKGMPFEQAVATYSQDTATSTNKTTGDMGFIDSTTYPELVAWAKTHKVGDISTAPVQSAQGYNIVKLVAEKPGDKEIDAAHILICYQGAQNCPSTDTDTKTQALDKINQLKKEVTAQNFADYAKKYSTDPSAAQTGGDLGFFKQGAMVPAFEQAVWNAPIGSIIGPIETQFGYHLIYKKAEQTPEVYDVARVLVKTEQASDIAPPPDPWKDTGLSGKQLQRAEVTENQQTGEVEVSLQFDAEGTKLFSDITTRNVGKPVAIFLDDQPISTPRVDEPITDGSAVITGNYSFADAKLLAQRLNSGALPVPVELLSQQTVDATLGADSLAKSFKAGLAGLLLVMIFMTIYYRLSGLLSVVSLGIYAVLNLAIFKLLGVTLTLSGIAGFILSIGMAVDANVLVFERLKEELRAGKKLHSAMEESFRRAWPSIRDGHVTTLISSVVLLWFGTGFVQGFAVVLGTGVLVSLFTAITVTRTIMRLVFGWFKKDEANWLFLGYTPKKNNDVVPTDKAATK